MSLGPRPRCSRSRSFHSLPHGHVAAVHAMAKKLGLPALLGPAGRHRDLALALIISRVVRAGEAVHLDLVG